MKLSVILPSHNPRIDYLQRTLAGLKSQALPQSHWELLLIDNGSEPPLKRCLVNWHRNGNIVRESKLGLTHARLAGIDTAQTPLLIWVDDDNVLEPDYLETSLSIFNRNPRLGAAGGRSLPEYETVPPYWFVPEIVPLGCRDLGDLEIISEWTSGAQRKYPAHAPIGAGMITRREAMLKWRENVINNSARLQFGRKGSALTSGEDNDINLTLLADGWGLGYFPELRLRHLIANRRLALDYQCRISRAASRDFIRVLTLHGVSPWPEITKMSLPLRKIKAWFTYRAWSSPSAHIRWQGACGHFEGRVRANRSEPHER